MNEGLQGATLAFQREGTPTRHCQRDGTFEDLSALCGSSVVIGRLEEAGSTLLALPQSGYSTRLRSSQLDFVREAQELYGSHTSRIRPATPSAIQITRMDEALGWLQIIPQSRYVLRRIVGARSLVHPVTARHLFSWRKVGHVMGADHKAVQRWHAEGIDIIVASLAELAAA